MTGVQTCALPIWVKLGASGLKNISKKAMSATKKFGLKSVNGTKNVFNNSIAKIFRRKLKEWSFKVVKAIFLI